MLSLLLIFSLILAKESIIKIETIKECNFIVNDEFCIKYKSLENLTPYSDCNKKDINNLIKLEEFLYKKPSLICKNPIDYEIEKENKTIDDFEFKPIQVFKTSKCSFGLSIKILKQNKKNKDTNNRLIFIEDETVIKFIKYSDKFKNIKIKDYTKDKEIICETNDTSNIKTCKQIKYYGSNTNFFHMNLAGRRNIKLIQCKKLEDTN